MKGWLVNDTLTCIPGTKTLWHDLLDWIPNLVDPVNGYVPFGQLNSFVDQKSQAEGVPDFVIRNCTFFPPLEIKTKTVSILQDIYDGPQKQQQIEVANSSDLVIYNSNFTKSFYRDQVTSDPVVIPLGIDFDHFCPREVSHPEVLPNSVLFIGAANNYPKGFDMVKSLVENTDYNFCLVMKDGFSWEHPRVKVFNKVNHDELVTIINSCKVAICTSVHETQHLAGLECAACDVPIVATDVGCYHGIENGPWGHKAKRLEDFVEGLRLVLSNLDNYSPRSYFKDYDKSVISKTWQDAIESIL